MAKDAIKLRIVIEEEFILIINIVTYIFIRQTHREGIVKTEADVKIPGQAPEAGRVMDCSLEPLEGVCPANTLVSDSWPPEL